MTPPAATHPDGWKRPSLGELNAVLLSHARFLARKPGGQRALLAFHDLSDVDLSYHDQIGRAHV